MRKFRRLDVCKIVSANRHSSSEFVWGFRSDNSMINLYSSTIYSCCNVWRLWCNAALYFLQVHEALTTYSTSSRRERMLPITCTGNPSIPTDIFFWSSPASSSTPNSFATLFGTRLLLLPLHLFPRWPVMMNRYKHSTPHPTRSVIAKKERKNGFTPEERTIANENRRIDHFQHHRKGSEFSRMWKINPDLGGGDMNVNQDFLSTYLLVPTETNRRLVGRWVMVPVSAPYGKQFRRFLYWRNWN